MTRAEHLQWAKDRAAAYLDKSDAPQAMASFISDMGKHEGTKDHPFLQAPMSALFFTHAEDVEGMRKHINGFN